ncbi:HNH endonuclease [Flavobacterium zepuense]|uniref:HNH endonuclease n=1 Tax=Flavobacterium zepuense TaxID=2593302 RepID=A0A552V4H9_9FLAO|nr:HNH endonuclease signature motif containing protein [Flavobacterium zepuense]TRW25357.1 HNH endonuclease [Flavobacterium zepuense]
MHNNDISYWMLKSVSEVDVSYKSNDGYSDELEIKYMYDDSVANHKQINAGDIAVIVNKHIVLGLAKISRILTSKSTKERRRCPFCRSTNYEYRKTRSPHYRCNKGHEFDNPQSENIEITQFSANYSDSFQLPLQKITIDKLRPFFTNNYNRNMSMQRLDKLFFSEYMKEELGKLNRSTVYPEATEAAHFLSDISDNSYLPDRNDERYKVWKAIMQRRGQKDFRDALRNTYGDKCMITGCEVLEVLEAAHINPYRGDKDNHITNGLLLRSDIHTLFDLDLIGIEPEKLTIHINLNIKRQEYTELSGLKLKLGLTNLKPNKTALQIRWEKFKLIDML